MNLATAQATSRAREIGLRKVLGGNCTSLVAQLLIETFLIVLSFALAVPIVYYVVNSWLSNFPHHVQLSWWMFVLPDLLVLIISIAVVGLRSIRIASINPVNNLKYE